MSSSAQRRTVLVFDDFSFQVHSHFIPSSKIRSTTELRGTGSPFIKNFLLLSLVRMCQYPRGLDEYHHRSAIQHAFSSWAAPEDIQCRQTHRMIGPFRTAHNHRSNNTYIHSEIQRRPATFGMCFSGHDERLGKLDCGPEVLHERG